MLILQFVLYTLAVVFVFSIPGIFFLSRSPYKLTKGEYLVFGTSIGFVLFTLFSYFLTLNSLLTLLVFIIGITGQLAIIAPSGIKVDGNILFWSSHGHDGMWHIALMETIKKGWPFENPIFA